MPLWKIAWRSIQRRSLASILTILSMALGVMLVVAVLLIVGVVDESFRSNSSLGYDTIVGAKGGQLQLTLNTVYYLSQPVENLPYKFYQEFLPSHARDPSHAAQQGVHYSDEVEFLSGVEWTSAENGVTISPRTKSIQLRVPLIPIEKLDSEKSFTLKLSMTSEGNTTNKTVATSATILPIRTDLPEALLVETPSVADSDSPAGEVQKTAVVAVDRVEVPFGARHAIFNVVLSHQVDSPVTFEAALIDGADGKYLEYLAEDKIAAIPVCLGDYFGEFRVVGTVPEFFDLVYDRERKLAYQFAEGGNFTGKGEYGIYEAILGAKVAREKGLRVGDLIQPSHGGPEGEAHDDFQVIGVLASSGTPQDRAVFVNMEGFNAIPQHIRDDNTKEVTSLLVDTRDAFRSMQLAERLNSEPHGQAVKPVAIIFGLFSRIVGPIRNLLLVITGLICVVSGISILVSIYNSMSDRKQEIAIMRSLGAGRSTVMTVVLLESVMISMIGGLIGWLGGHALIGLASGKIEAETGVVVSAFDLAPHMQELSYLLGEKLTPTISVEIWLIPMLILLAIVVGFLPALSAYRTDVAEALQSNP